MAESILLQVTNNGCGCHVGSRFKLQLHQIVASNRLLRKVTKLSHWHLWINELPINDGQSTKHFLINSGDPIREGGPINDWILHVDHLERLFVFSLYEHTFVNARLFP